MKHPHVAIRRLLMISHVCICTCPAPGAFPTMAAQKASMPVTENAQLSKECVTQGHVMPIVSVSQANVIHRYRLSYSAWIFPPGKGTGRTSDPHGGASCHSPGLCLQNSGLSEHWSNLSSLAHHPGQLQGDDEPGSLRYLRSGQTSQENSSLGKRHLQCELPCTTTGAVLRSAHAKASSCWIRSIWGCLQGIRVYQIPRTLFWSFGNFIQ